MEQLTTKELYEQGYVEFPAVEKDCDGTSRSTFQQFKITPDTYIPTPESSELVRLTREEAKSINAKTLVDVGVGSGALSISFMEFYPDIKIYGTDVSERALAVARENIQTHNLEKNILLCQSSYVDDLVCDEPDIIMANLPWGSKYTILPSNKERGLEGQPPVALFPKNGPMESYRELFASIKRKGWNNAIVLFETGNQTDISINRILPKDYHLSISRSKNYSVSTAWK